MLSYGNYNLQCNRAFWGMESEGKCKQIKNGGKMLLKAEFVIIILMLAVLPSTFAQQLQVVTFEFGTDVQNRELVGRDSVFSSDVGTVYCYTKIDGAENKRQVVHMWYYDDQLKASVTLPIESTSWRTWSSKMIRKDWTGKWRVIIEDGEGNLLTSKSFRVIDNE